MIRGAGATKFNSKLLTSGKISSLRRKIMATVLIASVLWCNCIFRYKTYLAPQELKRHKSSNATIIERNNLQTPQFKTPQFLYAIILKRDNISNATMFERARNIFRALGFLGPEAWT